MPEKIMFVDDERSLLNGIERRLGMEYDITTAESGADALAAIAEVGPFPVIITDMRMPGMNGVEFVLAAREVAPDTVYVMLTGNQDQETVARAVNEGQVFRFLNKPCTSDMLRMTVDASLKQHALITAEKELLHRTFCGAVGVLTDMISIAHPDVFSRSAEVEKVVADLRAALGIDDRWEYKLAAKLSMIGFALMSEEDRDGFHRKEHGGVESCELYARAASAGENVIARIPRLELVARMIGMQPSAQGAIYGHRDASKDQVVSTGATLLRLATHVDAQARQGVTAQQGLQHIKQRIPSMSIDLEEAVIENWPTLAVQRPIEVALNRLEEGMVLSHDVIGDNGAVLLRQGRRLSETTIERLHCHRDTLKNCGTVTVYEQVVSSLDKTLAAV
ncbi:Hydrogenase transcriptional regulatory protein hupR1 [Pseudobythopirellula maris]|uniref:Hydrogenase transcriptional regulatory protein hupR1 n=1 Tax=Pseudobythopirellula maris TaxID=2527991 RepID=A0A5C5ZM47_9BACT|nr:response regulator [Pseudobythopirellula maris]TWT88156.1 Hydrogenase transcriptional regulatory protein hupR1 [Pseudobythopirellula maris]